MAYVHPRKYADYALRPDLAGAARCLELLRGAGIAGVRPNDAFDWIHDTYLILIRMFPGGCPPTTIVSMNPRFDPHYHMRVGRKQTSVSFPFPSLPFLDYLYLPLYICLSMQRVSAQERFSLLTGWALSPSLPRAPE